MRCQLLRTEKSWSATLGTVFPGQLVVTYPLLAHRRPALRLGEGFALFPVPAFGDVEGAGVSCKLLPVGLVTAQEEGDAVVNLGNRQGHAAGFDPERSASAETVPDGDPVVCTGR